MRRKLTILLALLLAIGFAGLLIYGLRQGQATAVQQNAAAFCFT